MPARPTFFAADWKESSTLAPGLPLLSKPAHLRRAIETEPTRFRSRKTYSFRLNSRQLPAN